MTKFHDIFLLIGIGIGVLHLILAGETNNDANKSVSESCSKLTDCAKQEIEKAISKLEEEFKQTVSNFMVTTEEVIKKCHSNSQIIQLNETIIFNTYGVPKTCSNVQKDLNEKVKEFTDAFDNAKEFVKEECPKLDECKDSDVHKAVEDMVGAPRRKLTYFVNANIKEIEKCNIIVPNITLASIGTPSFYNFG